MQVHHDQLGAGVASVPRVLATRSHRAWVGTGLRYCLTAACAGSAGVHAALIMPHVAESVPLGLAFAAATAALAVAALLVRHPRHDSWALAATVTLLCLIAVSYLFSRSIGIPLLISQAEQLDPLGAGTTAAELLGAACGVALITRKDPG